MMLTSSARLNFVNSFVFSKAFSNDNGESGGDGGDDNGGGDGSSGSGTGDGSKDGQSSEDQAIKDPEKKRLSDEAAKYRTSLRDAEAKLSEATKKLQEIEDKDKSELEKAQGAVDGLTKKNEELQQLVQSQALKVAWVESGAASLFKNPSVAFKLLDTSQVKVEDGVADVKAMKELADALAKEGSVVLADAGSEDGERNPSGAPTNGKNGKPNGNANRVELEKRFPALRGRQVS